MAVTFALPVMVMSPPLPYWPPPMAAPSLPPLALTTASPVMRMVPQSAQLSAPPPVAPRPPMAAPAASDFTAALIVPPAMVSAAPGSTWMAPAREPVVVAFRLSPSRMREAPFSSVMQLPLAVRVFSPSRRMVTSAPDSRVTRGSHARFRAMFKPWNTMVRPWTPPSTTIWLEVASGSLWYTSSTSPSTLWVAPPTV